MPSNKPILSIIAAMAENGVIGKDNRMPWHLPADLRRFKSLTTGHVIIMGRKTYLSIGKPLPNRVNMVITRNPSFQAPGCIVVSTMEGAINRASEETATPEIFIIGGGDIYQQSLARCQRIYLTIVHHSFEGDTFFPAFDKNEWKEIERAFHQADKENKYNYSFLTLTKY